MTDEVEQARERLKGVAIQGSVSEIASAADALRKAQAAQPKTPPGSTIDDVSARFADLDKSERMFRSASGYLVKVRTLRTPADDPTTLHFSLTGALCDDGGHVIVQEGLPPLVGVMIGPAHVLTVHAESAVDVAAEIAKARELIVRRFELAAIHHAIASAIEGVG